MASHLKVLVGSLIVAGVTARASASCHGSKSAVNFYTGTSQYVYWSQPPGYSMDQTKLKGRFWQLGNRAAGNEGACANTACGADGPWLYFYSGKLYMDAILGSPEVVGCPTGRLITVAENVSTSGTGAAFLVGTADETPGQIYDWNYSMFGNRSLVPIPKPRLTGASRVGSTVTIDLAVDSAAAAAFGPSGAAAITGYRVVYALGAADPGRSPALYTTLGTISGSAGGTLSGQGFDCSHAPDVYFFAVQVLFDSGVASQ